MHNPQANRGVALHVKRKYLGRGGLIQPSALQMTGRAEVPVVNLGTFYFRVEGRSLALPYGDALFRI